MDKPNNELSKDNISINKKPMHLNVTIHIPISQEDKVSDFLVKSLKNKALMIPHKKSVQEKSRKKKYEKQEIIMPRPIKEEFDDICIVFGEQSQEYGIDNCISNINNMVKLTSTQKKSHENTEEFKNIEDGEYYDFTEGLNTKSIVLNENNEELGQHVTEISKCNMDDNSRKSDLSFNTNDFSIDCFKVAKKKRSFYQNESHGSQNNSFYEKANEIFKIEPTVVKQNESITGENIENEKCITPTITNTRTTNEEFMNKIIQQNEIDSNSFINEKLSKGTAEKTISDSESNSKIQTLKSSFAYKNIVVEDIWNSKPQTTNNINYIELSNELDKEDNIHKNFPNAKFKSNIYSNISTQEIDENISDVNYKESEENNDDLKFDRIQLSQNTLSEDLFSSRQTTPDLSENCNEVEELGQHNFLKNADLLNKQQFEFPKRNKGVVTTQYIGTTKKVNKNVKTITKTMENLSDKLIINDQSDKSKKKKKFKMQTDSSIEETFDIIGKLNKHMLISNNNKDIYHKKMSQSQKVLPESEESKYKDMSSVYKDESIMRSQNSKFKIITQQSDKIENDRIIKIDKSKKGSKKMNNKELSNCKENPIASLEMQINDEKSTKTEEKIQNYDLDSSHENCSDYQNITKKNEEGTDRNRKRKKRKELDTQIIINDLLNNGASARNKKLKLSSEDELKNSQEKIKNDKRVNYNIKQYFLTDNSKMSETRTEKEDTENEVWKKQSKNDEFILQFQNISNIQSKMGNTTPIVSNANKNAKAKSKKLGENKKINDYFCSQNNELNNKYNLPILNEESTSIHNLDKLEKIAECQNTIKEKSKKWSGETEKAVDINKHGNNERTSKPKSVKNKVIHENESSSEEEDLDSILDFVKTYVDHGENLRDKKTKKNNTSGYIANSYKSKSPNKRLDLDSSDNCNSDSSVCSYAKEYNLYIHNKCSKNEGHCNSKNKSKSKSKKNSSLSSLVEREVENDQNNPTMNNINNSSVEENKQPTYSKVSKGKELKSRNIANSNNCVFHGDKHLNKNKQNNNFDQSGEIENHSVIEEVYFHTNKDNGILELTESKNSESGKNSKIKNTKDVAKLKKNSLLNFLTIKDNGNIENNKNIKNLNTTENINAVAGSKNYISQSSKDVDDVVTSDNDMTLDDNTNIHVGDGSKFIESTPASNFKDKMEEVSFNMEQKNSKTRNIIKWKDIYTDTTSSDFSGGSHDKDLHKNNKKKKKRTYRIESNKKEEKPNGKNLKKITEFNSENDNNTSKKHCEEISNKNCSQKKLVFEYFDKVLSERYKIRPSKPSNRRFKSGEFVFESDDTDNSIRSRIGISDFETDKDKDSECEESKARMMEIITCAEDELLNVMEENEQLKNLEINITWDVPMSHRIETRMSSCSTKDQQQMFHDLGFKMKSGPFSKTEDDIIKGNFKKFCSVHNLRYDPVPFLNFNYGTVSMLTKKERINFARFLGRALENRKLYRIYQRFKVLYSTYNKGRFTPQEDAVILQYMKIMKDSSKKFSALSKILRRPRLAIEKRYKLLQENFFKLSPKDYPNFVKCLMDITKVDSLEGLRNKEITDQEWIALSKELSIYKDNLKIFWTASLYTKLFHKGPIHVDDIMKKLIKRLDKREESDYRKLNWTKLAKPFEDITRAFLYRIFKKVRNVHVPQKLHSNLRRCVTYLKYLYAENDTVMADIQNIVLTL